jgi:hypothetical protein
VDLGIEVYLKVLILKYLISSAAFQTKRLQPCTCVVTRNSPIFQACLSHHEIILVEGNFFPMRD